MTIIRIFKHFIFLFFFSANFSRDLYKLLVVINFSVKTVLPNFAKFNQGSSLFANFCPIDVTIFLIRFSSIQDLKDYMRQAGEVTYADAHKPRRNEGCVEFASERVSHFIKDFYYLITG